MKQSNTPTTPWPLGRDHPDCICADVPNVNCGVHVSKLAPDDAWLDELLDPFDTDDFFSGRNAIKEAKAKIKAELNKQLKARLEALLSSPEWPKKREYKRDPQDGSPIGESSWVAIGFNEATRRSEAVIKKELEGLG